MSKQAINLNDTTDPAVWAAEFCRIIGEKIPAIRDEEGWMISWFANAIMAGHDGAMRRTQAEIDKLRTACMLLNSPRFVCQLSGDETKALKEALGV